MTKRYTFSPTFIKWVKQHINPDNPYDIAALSSKAPHQHRRTLQQIEYDPNYKASFFYLLPFLLLWRRYRYPYYYRRYRRRRYRRRRRRPRYYY